MSGIYIPGLEMPTSCADCPFGDAVRCNLMPGVPAWWAEYDKCVKEKRLHSQCPLVPVPPHGDLIDLSAKVNAQYYDDAYEEWSIKTVTVEDILYGICEEMPPIIIPAEEGE